MATKKNESATYDKNVFYIFFVCAALDLSVALCRRDWTLAFFIARKKMRKCEMRRLLNAWMSMDVCGLVLELVGLEGILQHSVDYGNQVTAMTTMNTQVVNGHENGQVIVHDMVGNARRLHNRFKQKINFLVSVSKNRIIAAAAQKLICWTPNGRCFYTECGEVTALLALSNDHLVLGLDTGNLSIWGIEKQGFKRIKKVRAHKHSVGILIVFGEVVVSGSRDAVMAWDPVTWKRCDHPCVATVETTLRNVKALSEAPEDRLWHMDYGCIVDYHSLLIVAFVVCKNGTLVTGTTCEEKGEIRTTSMRVECGVGQVIFLAETDEYVVAFGRHRFEVFA